MYGSSRNWLVLGIVGLVIVLLLCGGLALLAPNVISAFRGAVPTPSGPVGPAAPTPPAPVAGKQLSIDEFARMWSTHPATEGPGPLMEELNNFFDGGGYQFGGQFSGKTGWDVPAGSVVWTDLLDQKVTYTGTNTEVDMSKDFVRIRCQGNWCVFYAYANVHLPTPGRYLKTDRWLDPAKDLAGWR
jgi:hypothetical protein